MYQTAWCHVSKDCSLSMHCCEDVKCHRTLSVLPRKKKHQIHICLNPMYRILGTEDTSEVEYKTDTQEPWFSSCQRKRVYHSPKCPEQLWGPQQPHIQWVTGFLP